MASANLLLQSSVAELLEHYPTTAAVFMQHRMACVGCPFAAFETIAEALTIYQINRTTFVTALQYQIQNNPADKTTLPHRMEP